MTQTTAYLTREGDPMRDLILIVNIDHDFSRIIAHKLRNEHIYCKVVPSQTDLASVQQENPSGIILAGGVTARRGAAQTLDARILEMGLPVLALGSAARTVCEVLGGHRRDEEIAQRAARVSYSDIVLFDGVEPGERWLEHVHDLALPDGVTPIAEAEGFTLGFAPQDKPVYGLQFQIEQNDPDGLAVLSNFALKVAGCTPWWFTEAFAERAKAEIHKAAGNSEALCAVSGGLDSTVCALLAHAALGDRLHCVFVDTGLFRQGEAEATCAELGALGLPIHCVQKRAETLGALSGLTDMEAKRNAVHEVVMHALAEAAETQGGCKLLLSGTTYTDIIVGGRQAQNEGASLGGMRIVEPLRELFRDEVRALGALLELPEDLRYRQPFPLAGLAARIFGEVTAERVDTLMAADAIFKREIVAAGLDRKLWKYYAALSSTPGAPAEEWVVLLRAVTETAAGMMPARLPYDLQDRTVDAIAQTVPGISRIVYDITRTKHADAAWR